MPQRPSRSGLTPAQALEFARSLRARRPKPSELSLGMAERASSGIIAVRERAVKQAQRILRSLFEPVDPYDGDQIAEFTQAGARHLGAAQKATATAAVAGQQLLLSTMGVNVKVQPPAPIDVRAPGVTFTATGVELDRVGVSVRYVGQEPIEVSAADMTTVEVLNRPVRKMRYLESKGATREQALEAGLSRLDAIAEANMMLAQRLAEAAVINAAANLDGSPVVGMRRIIHPELSLTGTCGLCIAASDRLYTVRELLPMHHLCKCTSAAVTEEFDPADELNAVDLRRLYRDAGGTSRAHLKRTRYKQDDHGELGPTLKPERKYKARGKKPGDGEPGVGVDLNESLADIARRQLPLFEANLAKLRADGLADDSAQVKYHETQIEKYRSRLESDTGAPPSDEGPRVVKGTDGTQPTPAAAPGRQPPKPPQPPVPPLQNGGVVGGEDDDNDPLKRFGYASLASEQRSLNRLSDQERAAIESFALNSYIRVNGALRELREMTPEIQREVDVIRSGLRKYPLDRDVRVTREVSGHVFGITGPDAADAIDELIGQVFDEPGFMSTSMAAKPAHSSEHVDPVVLDLLVPAGTPALALGELAEFSLEHEMLLIDARRYEIIGKRYDQAENRWRLFGLVDPEA